MSQWYHSKKWKLSQKQLTLRGETEHNPEDEHLDPKYKAKAAQMMHDKDYQKKYAVLVERMMSGKRIANSKYIGSPVQGD
jgi:hypothetical protein